jgi:hypothetical protein
VHEEDDDSDGAPLQAPRAPRNSHPRSGSNSRSRTKQRVFTRDEGFAIAAVIDLATKEKPFVGMKRIVRHARDYEIHFPPESAGIPDVRGSGGRNARGMDGRQRVQ